MSRPTTDQVTDQYTVKNAARSLGISENAVMQRIKRGTLNARKHNGRWLVTVTGDLTDQSPTGRSNHHRPVDDQERDQSTDQETTSHSPSMLALSYQALAPMMERIEAIARENGELRERLSYTERERDELAAEVELLRAIRAATNAAPDNAVHPDMSDPTGRSEAEPLRTTPKTLQPVTTVTARLRRLFERS